MTKFWMSRDALGYIQSIDSAAKERHVTLELAIFVA